MKKEKSGFALLMQWAGEDRKFIYASIFLALISSVCGIVPYLLFYRIIEIINVLKARGKYVLVVSHDNEFMNKVCDDIFKLV